MWVGGMVGVRSGPRHPVVPTNRAGLSASEGSMKVGGLLADHHGQRDPWPGVVSARGAVIAPAVLNGRLL